MRPELELEDLGDKIPAINESNALYAAGDHWQGGEGWSGPLPDPNSPVFDSVLGDIERVFVSRDTLKEIRLRERWALTGNAWTWVLLDAEGKPLAEAEAVELRAHIERWLEDKQIISTVADALEKSGWSGDDGIPGRGLLRFYIPEERLNNGKAEAEDMGMALDLIELESPESEQGVVFVDADSGYEPAGFVEWTEEFGGDEFDRAEIVYLNDQKITVLESLIASDAVKAGKVELNLGGRLTMYQMERPLLIDASLRSMQRFMNSSLTAFQSAVSSSGWREDYFMGVMPPGSWVETDGGQEQFVSEPFSRGPGRAHFLQARTIIDDDGSETAVGSASHSESLPVSPHLFVEAQKAMREAMLATAFQEFTSLTGLAQASGEKLQLAKGDFEAAMTDSANEMRLMARWMLETAIALAEAIMGAPEPSGIQIPVAVIIDTGVITTEQKVQLSTLVAEKFISHHTALSEAGYQNPTAELLKLAEQIELAGEADGEGGTETDGTAGTEPGGEDTPPDDTAV